MNKNVTYKCYTHYKNKNCNIRNIIKLQHFKYNTKLRNVSEM